jgi:nitronate monooxygenase
MIPSWPPNRITSTLRIEYPIIQGPLGGLKSQKPTAAVSNFGGLGSLGAHSLVPNAINEAIAEIRSLTSKPFAINLWVSMEDEGAPTSDEGVVQQKPCLASASPGGARTIPACLRALRSDALRRSGARASGR